MMRREAGLCVAWAGRYLPDDTGTLLYDLPVLQSPQPSLVGLVAVELPDWAQDLAVGSPARLLVPQGCVAQAETDSPAWRRCDWWRALFEFLTCTPEWLVERDAAPIHSYALRLPEDLAPLHEHAWANRILLFLRRWWTVEHEADETAVFGALPEPRIVLTHDVDGISKTGAIRLKQAAFSGFNALRSARRGRWGRSSEHLGRGLRFGLGSGDYWQFPVIQALEDKHGQRSLFNFYGGPGGWRRGIRKTLLDPAYDVHEPRVAGMLRELVNGGWSIGLHQSFDAWQDAASMRSEKARLEQAAETPVTACRQHWLRFSLEHTWRAQEAAGLELDTTLGFNEKPGFRNGGALSVPAWIHSEKRASKSLKVLPLVLMDSHLFDYGALDPDQRRRSIDAVLAELRAVGGEASVVWHQRVFHSDYAWGSDYEYLLSQL